ncbi:MAG: glycosyltransferase family 2 protein [Actinomycetota bacterium]
MATAITTAPPRPEVGDGAPPSVLAIVVTHEGRRWLKECLVALADQTYVLLDVLVVDDASPDFRASPHLKRLVKRHLRRRRWGFLRTRRSLGFGGAINWALSRIRTDADLLLFIHDDAVLDPGAVQRMTTRMTMDEHTAIVGPKVVAWDDPERLEEVGMAVDRFGYPYKGLERGEIDLGQHDAAAEVFYVTSTCMLIRHTVFRDLRGWDAPMRAFSEDLDLCWRARVAGHGVVVEPQAKARHAIALATGQRRSRFTPARYYIRRNRLRTVAKNVSSTRLIALLPQFVLLSFTEMLGFIVLRQPAEIFNLLKALLWNLFTSPQTLSERLRVQRTRKVADRRLRRLTVRESTRVRAYVSNQAERLEQAWGRRTEVVAQRSSRVRELSHSFRGWPLIAASVAVFGLALGFRHFLLSPPVTVGELLPYPDRATALWTAFLSPWQGTGLGHSGPTSPALLLLGAVPLVAFGAVAVAQKLLIGLLGVAAFLGAYRLVSDVVDRPARLVAGLVYVLGAVGFAGMRQGALPALAFGAAAPFALHSLLGTTGWMRPSGWDGGRAAARLALGAAVAGAFVPGALVLLAGAALVLGALRTLIGPRRILFSAGPTVVAGLGGAWLLLLPWSASWLAPGGALEALRRDEAFASQGMLTVLLGQTPEGPALVGLGLVVLAVVALALGAGRRRALGLALTAVVVATGWLVAATSAGSIPPLVASPLEAGVLASTAFAGLAGLAVGAFRLDLPRRRLGWIHAAALAGLAGAAVLIVVGLVPALWRGAWTPGRSVGAADAEVIAQIRSVLGEEAHERGQFRALWVGARWAAWGPAGARVASDHLVTGPRGQTLVDAFARSDAAATNELERAVGSVESGATDAGGRLLGGFNIGYVVLERAPQAHRWLEQRDLEIIRSEPGYLLLRNGANLPRAATFEEVPSYVRALAGGDPTLVAPAVEAPEATAVQRSASRYVAGDVVGPGVAWLAESGDERWSASLNGTELERLEVVWGNAFRVPSSAPGTLTVSYPYSAGEVAGLVLLGLGWIVAVGAAFSSPQRKATPA